MRHYKQLTYTDRLNIEKWRKEGMKPQQIADTLRVHVSTIYRELDRGAYDRLNGQTWEMEAAYSPDIAEQKYQENLRAKGPDLKIGNDYEFARYLETTMTEKECSPAAALGYAQNEGKEFKTTVSVPTIYSYIKKGVFGNLTQEDLPRHGKHKGNYQRVGRKKAARAPAGESIEKRPESVKDREEFGHWEMDTVYSKEHQQGIPADVDRAQDAGGNHHQTAGPDGGIRGQSPQCTGTEMGRGGFPYDVPGMPRGTGDCNGLTEHTDGGAWKNTLNHRGGMQNVSQKRIGQGAGWQKTVFFGGLVELYKTYKKTCKNLSRLLLDFAQ